MLFQKLVLAFEFFYIIKMVGSLPQRYQTYKNGKKNKTPQYLGEYNQFIRKQYKSQAPFRFQPWPEGIIPYDYTSGYHQSDIDKIQDVMMDLEALTCVRFKKRSNEKIFIRINAHSRECSSYVGYIGYPYNVNLSPTSCTTRSIILHELMHVLGLYHEHTRYDRDNYVNIHMNNIEEDAQNNFRKFDSIDITNEGIPYDYHSVMHYRPNSFSKNMLNTITPKEEVNISNSPLWPSDKDIMKMDRLYSCTITQNFRKSRRKRIRRQKAQMKKTKIRRSICAKENETL